MQFVQLQNITTFVSPYYTLLKDAPGQVSDGEIEVESMLSNMATTFSVCVFLPVSQGLQESPFWTLM